MGNFHFLIGINASSNSTAGARATLPENPEFEIGSDDKGRAAAGSAKINRGPLRGELQIQRISMIVD